MARALLGHVGMPNDPGRAYEISRHRQRIAELEGELEELRRPHREVLDLELHALTDEATPVLA